MLKFEYPLGEVVISRDYLNSLVGHVASRCFGVAGMQSGSTTESLLELVSLGRELDRGVRLSTSGGQLVIELHIAVTYGVNIAAIVRSIVSEVRYAVETATGIRVRSVNVHVDKMIAEQL